MSRRLVYAAIAVVLAGVLFLVLRGGDDDDGTRAAGGTPEAGGGGAADRGSLPPPARPRPRDGSRGSADPGDPAQPGGPRTYVTDTGNLVRDHRDGVREPVALPAPMPPSERTMNPMVTGNVYRALAPIVRKCGVDAGGERGANPVAHVTLTVDVAGGQLTTVDATAVTSDVGGSAADQVVACIRDRASALTVAANGEPDRSGYIVQYPIRLRQ